MLITSYILRITAIKLHDKHINYETYEYNAKIIISSCTLNISFEMRHPRYVSNHSVENEYEKTVINTTVYTFIASGVGLATTTCVGP
jgi:hypothetical protein